MSSPYTSLTTIVDGLAFGEAFRWHDDRLWYVDMHAWHVCSWSETDGARIEFQSNGALSGLGWNAAGELLVVSMADRRLLRVDGGGGVHVVADLGAYTPHSINDLVMDPSGRCYIGTFGFDLAAGAPLEPGVILAVDADGSHRVAADNLVFPNGMVITDGGRTLVVAETFAGRLTAFTRHDDGTLTDRRVWAMLPEGVGPDGICLDADGAIWVSSTSTAAVLRVAEGGAVLQSIDTAPKMAVCCVLGGTTGHTLFITTCSSFDADECRTTRAADIRVLDVSVGAPT